MQSFFEWFDTKGIDPNRPWLILGKGPSFAKRKEHDLSSYHTMSLEHFSARETALLHFTDMNTQPWVSKENPLGYLWTGDLIDAIDAGAVLIDFVKREIAAGHVRPSLMYQVENRIQDAFLLPRKAWRMDTKFFPPYRSLPKHHGSLWLRSGNRLRTLLRRGYQKTPASYYQRILYDWFFR